MKPSKAIQSWVEQQTKTGPVRMLAALGCLLVGAAVLFLTFWFVYGVLYICLDWIVPHSHELRLWLSFAVVALLFVFNATTDRRSLEDYRLTTDGIDDRPIVLTIPLLMVSGSMINPLTFGSMRSFTRVLISLLFVGPRIVTGAVRMFGRGLRISRVDVRGAAAALTCLASSVERVPMLEIAQAIPQGHDVVAVLTQIQEFDGVMLLLGPPVGMTLLTDFREELYQLRAQRRRKKDKAEGAGAERLE